MPRPTRSHRGGGRLSSLSRDFLRRETKHDCGHENMTVNDHTTVHPQNPPWNGFQKITDGWLQRKTLDWGGKGGEGGGNEHYHTAERIIRDPCCPRAKPGFRRKF